MRGLRTVAFGVFVFANCLAGHAATFTVTLPEVNGADYVSGFPIAKVTVPAVSFASQIPAGEVVDSVAVEGFFGNSLAMSTAAVEVSINGVLVATCVANTPCTIGGALIPWNYTFTPSEAKALGSGLAELSYVQTNLRYVRLAPTTLTITTKKTPVVPVSVPAAGIPALILSGLGIFGAAGYLSRRRKLL